jgi:hypothetical protein
LLFELHIRFLGEEGDEMSVVELTDDFIDLINERSTVDLKTIELVIPGPLGCIGEGRCRGGSVSS